MTIGKENEDKIRAFVKALIDLGCDDIKENAMLSVPKSIIAKHQNSLVEIESIIDSQICESKNKKEK